MIAEVFAAQHFVDEAGVRGPVVFGQRFGEGDMELKVLELACEVLEVFLIENFLPRASAVPKADLASGLERFEEVRKVRAQGSHAGTATEVDHFVLRFLDEEIAEGSEGLDRVAGLEVPDIRGSDTGLAVLAARWGGDADIETQLRVLVGVGRQRVVAPQLRVVFGFVIENMICSPDCVVGWADLETFE